MELKTEEVRLKKKQEQVKLLKEDIDLLLKEVEGGEYGDALIVAGLAMTRLGRLVRMASKPVRNGLGAVWVLVDELNHEVRGVFASVDAAKAEAGRDATYFGDSPPRFNYDENLEQWWSEDGESWSIKKYVLEQEGCSEEGRRMRG